MKAFNEADDIKIISPFIQRDIIGKLLRNRKPKIQLITRFNVNDFYKGVSSLDALGYLKQTKNASVSGIKHLHAKVYVFDGCLAFVTSANLTGAGLYRNIEYGVILQGKEFVSECTKYFDQLWSIGNLLTDNNIIDWKEKISNARKNAGTQDQEKDLGDFGADFINTNGDKLYNLPETDIPFPNSEQAFIKFAGFSVERCNAEYNIIQEIADRGSPWRCYYPWHPRQNKENDLMFFSMITNDNDIRIYGYGFAISHDESIDIVTSKEEMINYPWRKHFSKYIRIRDAKFLKGKFSDGISLNELKNDLKHLLFHNTKQNYLNGSGNTNPHLTYRQKADVKLSQEGRVEVFKRLEQKMKEKGIISQEEIEKAYQLNGK